MSFSDPAHSNAVISSVCASKPSNTVPASRSTRTTMPAAVPNATVRPLSLVWQTRVSSSSTAANRSWAPRLQFDAVRRSCRTASLLDLETRSQSSAKTASSLVLVSAYSSVNARARQASGDSSGSLVAAAARTVRRELGCCGATSAPAERAPASRAAQTLKELLRERIVAVCFAGLRAIPPRRAADAGAFKWICFDSDGSAPCARTRA
mmetsp:Transcript_9643/g.25706  ORF Transcript_9643/g.25706 Transcript_9643/m.25706 type:complete len:208 (-) Transcript_9643:103-726(-)